jgi:hypothetical protein
MTWVSDDQTGVISLIYVKKEYLVTQTPIFPIARKENQEAALLAENAIEQAAYREIQKLPDWVKLASERVKKIGAQG